jgi:sugar lactone lactonase YvrE
MSNPMTAVLLSASLIAASTADPTYVFTTFAGAPPSLVAVQPLDHPYDVAADSAGNVFISDTFNDVIRKLSPSGDLTVFAGQLGKSGSADGNGTAAQFTTPRGIAVDAAGNVFVGDEHNHTIRKITPSGDVTTLAGQPGESGSADGSGSSARFNFPDGVAIGANGTVYVADSSNDTIRKITPSGSVTTLAGKAGVDGFADGSGSSAVFNDPEGVAVDASGNVYVADAGNNVIRKVTPSGLVTTLAGGSPLNDGSADGVGTAARFHWPRDVAVDGSGNIYVADQSNATIRKITSSGVVSTFAGKAGAAGATDGVGSDARFNDPWGVGVDLLGNVYVADSANNAIRKITPQALVTTLGSSVVREGSADGFATSARFNSPQGIAVDSAGNVFVADTNNHTIRKISPAGDVTTFAGTAGVSGSTNANGTAARFYYPSDLAIDASGNLYVDDELNNSVRKITPSGDVTTYATGFSFHEGIAVDTIGNVYVSSTSDHTVMMIRPTGSVLTLAGSAGNSGTADGNGSAARFNFPGGLAVDSAGNVYVADEFNGAIRKITPNGDVTTFAGVAGQQGSADGNGSNARFQAPSDIAIDSAGNLYVTDAGGRTIRKVTPSRDVTTIGGSFGVSGDVDAAGANARFKNPSGIAIAPDGRLFISDTGNDAIRVGAVVQPKHRSVRH